MFNNLSWVEIAALLLLALFIFGDRLPQVISDGLRLLRNLRRMARNATSDLSRELGTDIQLEDLNPKTFIRRHVLSDSEQQALLKPLQGISEELREQVRGLASDLQEVATEAEDATGRRGARPRGTKPVSRGGPTTQTGTGGAGGRSSGETAVSARPALDDIS